MSTNRERWDMDEQSTTACCPRQTIPDSCSTDLLAKAQAALAASER